MYSYYALHTWGWMPTKFLNLPTREKVLVMAMIDERIKQEKRERAKAKRRR